jgi:hypothetical protein
MRWGRSCRVGRAKRGPPHSQRSTWRSWRQICRYELEQHRQFFPASMVIQTRQIGLDLGMSGICIERLGYDAQPQCSNLGGTNASDARTCFDIASHQLQQALRGRDLPARHGNTCLLSIVSKLEVRAGDPRSRCLPKCAAWDMSQKILVVSHFIHGGTPVARRRASAAVPGATPDEAGRWRICAFRSAQLSYRGEGIRWIDPDLSRLRAALPDLPTQ